MENRIRIYNKIGAIIVFAVLPLLIYYIGDFPRRSVLKEAISIVTILAFFMMLIQFYLSRANNSTLQVHKMSTVVKWHKALGYIFIGLLLFHPFLIVVPRFYEAGVDPMDAFTLITTSFDSQGIVFGMVAYSLMFILVTTSFFRNMLPMSYKTWRVTHGILSVLFVAIAAFHVSVIGRHSNVYLVGLIAILAIVGISLLLKVYLFKTNKK